MLRNLCLASAILMLAMWGPANAQTISGDLVVNVYDASGAVVTAANLVLTEVATKLKQESATDSLGNALFPQLKPGLYHLSVSASGFQKKEVTDIRIQVGQRARVDVEMPVGQVTESVTVSAAASHFAQQRKRRDRSGAGAAGYRQLASERPQLHSARDTHLGRRAHRYRNLPRDQLDRTQRHDAFDRRRARVKQ